MGLPKGSKVSAQARENIIHGLLGRKLSDETKEKIRLSNIGQKRSASTKEKMRLRKLGVKRPSFEMENNPNWKGDNVSKGAALHRWIRKHLPKPKLCQICNMSKSYDLANITGNYNREFNNWKYLCRRCHMLSDGRMKNLTYNHNSS